MTPDQRIDALTKRVESLSKMMASLADCIVKTNVRMSVHERSMQRLENQSQLTSEELLARSRELLAQIGRQITLK